MHQFLRAKGDNMLSTEARDAARFVVCVRLSIIPPHPRLRQALFTASEQTADIEDC